MALTRSFLFGVLVVGCSSAPVAPPSTDAAVDEVAPILPDAAVPVAADASAPDGPGPLSFVVEVSLPGLARNPMLAYPERVELTAFLDLRSSPPRLIASQRGTVGEAPLMPTADGWRTTGRLTVGARFPEAKLACRWYGPLELEHLELVREGENVRGTFDGRIEFLDEDVIHYLDVQGTLTGVPDRQPPGIVVESPPSHPVDDLSVRLTEAIPAATEVRLVGPEGSSRLVKAREPMGKPLATLFLPGPAILAGHRLVFDPAFSDLIGNTGPSSIMLESGAPLLPEDGFEGPVAPLLIGDAKLVEGAGAIGGKRSVLVTPTQKEARFSLRLAVAPGDSVLRARVRVELPPGPVTLPITVMTADGQRVAPLPVTVLPPPIGGGTAGAPQAIEVPLPAGTKGEVVIDVHYTSQPCGPYPGPLAGVGMLLDDLRLEPR